MIPGAHAIVKATGLVKEFRVPAGHFGRRQRLLAVNRVTFAIERGETLGIVGESGSGKTTVANMVAGLLPRTSGDLSVAGADFDEMRSAQRRRHRRRVQTVFQDPYTSLAPTASIESSLVEPLRAHRHGSRSGLHSTIEAALSRVRLDASLGSRFPSELSGGQLQRVSIARALMLEPDLLVLDEPVSALDVCTKAEIINLLADLKDELGLSYLFISHDLSTLRVLADRIAVMYLGSVVEIGPRDDIYDTPKHPYTRALLSAIPIPDPVVQRERRRIALTGDVPSPLETPPGCPFHSRCPDALAQCAATRPEPVLLGQTTVACHLFDGPPAG